MVRITFLSTFRINSSVLRFDALHRVILRSCSGPITSSARTDYIGISGIRLAENSGPSGTRFREVSLVFGNLFFVSNAGLSRCAARCAPARSAQGVHSTRRQGINRTLFCRTSFPHANHACSRYIQAAVIPFGKKDRSDGRKRSPDVVPKPRCMRP